MSETPITPEQFYEKWFHEQIWLRRCGKNMGNDLLIIPRDLNKGHPGPCERNVWPVAAPSAPTAEQLLRTIQELGRVTMATEAGRDTIMMAIDECLDGNTGKAAPAVPQSIPGAAPDDPVRRDREGWEAGVKAAANRLQEEIDSWEEELKNAGHNVESKRFIERRIGQIKTHIAQILELRHASLIGVRATPPAESAPTEEK